jgi:transcriptional regulator with XRE-family HTH domain
MGYEISSLMQATLKMMGISQTEVAHAIHRSKSAINSYATGARKTPEDVMTDLAKYVDDYDFSASLAHEQYGTLKGMDSPIYGERPSELHDVQEAEELERQQSISSVELNRILASTQRPLNPEQYDRIQEYAFQMLDEIITEIKLVTVLARTFLHESLTKLIRERHRTWVKAGLMKRE